MSIVYLTCCHQYWWGQLLLGSMLLVTQYNEFLLSGLSTKDMPVTKADLIDVLCDYIMTIQDDTTLE
jgi:hypothetical protein